MQYNYLSEYIHPSHKHFLYPTFTRVTSTYAGDVVSRNCDVCNHSISFHQEAFCCPLCDFDICVACFQKDHQGFKFNPDEDLKQYNIHPHFQPSVPVPFEEKDIEAYYIGTNVCILNDGPEAPIQSDFPRRQHRYYNKFIKVHEDHKHNQTELETE